jgi:cell division protein FtsL
MRDSMQDELDLANDEICELEYRIELLKKENKALKDAIQDALRILERAK